MDEILILLDKADAAFDDASLLITHKRNEAAANRLYYSVLYSMQAALLIRNEIPKTHKGIHIRFHLVFIKEGIFPEIISEHVQVLLNLRQGGDYDLEEVPDEAVQKAMTYAQEVLKIIRKYVEENTETE